MSAWNHQQVSLTQCRSLDLEESVASKLIPTTARNETSCPAFPQSNMPGKRQHTHIRICVFMGENPLKGTSDMLWGPAGDGNQNLMFAKRD